ncbi:hypothetical protein HPB48_020957 [Haemaphysalis longicornis]|uniref:Uncharacterized protein n=1 Tax=Haemaphysalis longicornis TaxID=44386 RepID=A0A9J6FP67_HAELO|nr:hypothetical protein HPB48_020957 [Haemaphysalis longicornis]
MTTQCHLQPHLLVFRLQILRQRLRSRASSPSPKEPINAEASVQEELQRHRSLSPRSANSFQLYMNLREEHLHIGGKETCRTRSDCTGVSFRKILDVKSKAKGTGGKLTTPSQKKARKARAADTALRYMNGFTLCALRNIVHDLFRRNEPPTATEDSGNFRSSEHLRSLRT